MTPSYAKIGFTQVFLILFSLLPDNNLSAENLFEQVVTYADFSHINSVSSSLTHTYFSTTEGIIIYNKIDEFWEEPLTGTDGIDHRNIYRIWTDKFNDKLYVETMDGFFEYDNFFRKWYGIPELSEFRSEERHVSPPDIMFPPVEFLYSPNGSISDRYGRTFVFGDFVDDLSGNYWIGTWGQGAAKASKSSTIIELLPFGLIQNHVQTIYNDSGIFWIAGSALYSSRTGISIYDIEENSFSFIESGIDNFFPAYDINCITADTKIVYIGTDNGLFLFDKQQRTVETQLNVRHGLTDNAIYSLAVIGDSIFVGTRNGMSIIHSNGDKVEFVHPEQFLNKSIYDLQVVDSSLWIATSEGVYRLLLSNNRLQKFQDREAFLFGGVYDIDKLDNFLWFATDDGIMQLDLISASTNPYRVHTTYLKPRKMAVNDSIAVVASDRGMTLVFYRNDPPFTKEFTTDDGLPSDNIFSLEFDYEFLWIGSDKGLTRFLWDNPRRVD